MYGTGRNLLVCCRVAGCADDAGAPFAEAIRAASEVPAKLLGLSTKGHLEIGADADIVLWSPDHTVLATVRTSRSIHSDLSA